MMTFDIVVLNTLPLFVTYSNLVSGFESTAVHEIRKYKFYDIACSDVLFVVHRYHYKFVGLARDRNRSGDSHKLYSSVLGSEENDHDFLDSLCHYFKIMYINNFL